MQIRAAYGPLRLRNTASRTSLQTYEYEYVADISLINIEVRELAFSD
jgi:hypothetical protein